ncbi:unnamed protein product [Pseudo-nitzschia multistriata]|uniref:Uncharacterized protein n=1 Tax=Pseudo-nitzschia multistriata TaxID=183589 RepID=A0A448ZGZ1_9STRA|nr:unnamed protein product [Pseudo-nitzschia multistriata]
MASHTARFLEKSVVPLLAKHPLQWSPSLRSGQVATASSSIGSTRWFSDDGPKKRIVKVKKKERKSAADTGRSRDLELLLGFLDAPKTKPPPADEEETARRETVRRNYTIGTFRKHNEENHEIACKLKLKKHAISMLPKRSNLKEWALKVDDKHPPRWRTIPAWTPPIPDFNPSDFMVTEE